MSVDVCRFVSDALGHEPLIGSFTTRVPASASSTSNMPAPPPANARSTVGSERFGEEFEVKCG
jgi:hypothetical protein